MRLPPFPAKYRASGLLLHVTSLPSRYGIGDLGPAAVAWVDRLHETGQTWWQTLPLGPTGYGDSPYQSLSSFAGNPLLISPDWLIEDELVKASDCAGGPFSATAVDFDAVKRFKYALLEAAWKSFGTGARSDLHPDFERFGQEKAHWLDDYALFSALKARYGGASYLEWPEELVRRAPAALEQARRELASQTDLLRFAQLLQFRPAARHVPAAAPTAELGRWVPGPGAGFFNAVRKGLGGVPFIAEDLGLITPDVGALRDSFDLPGTRVLQFAFDGHSDNPYLPDNYVPNAVVYTGTHDNPTTRGWYKDLPDAERRNLWSYLKRAAGTGEEATSALLGLAWSSAAALAIAPLQDVLNLGKEARMNQPGRAEGNWRWRCTDEMLSAPAFQSLRDLTRAASRPGPSVAVAS